MKKKKRFKPDFFSLVIQLKVLAKCIKIVLCIIL